MCLQFNKHVLTIMNGERSHLSVRFYAENFQCSFVPYDAPRCFAFIPIPLCLRTRVVPFVTVLSGSW